MAKKSSGVRTPSGYWKEKEEEFIAIRSGVPSSSSGCPSSSYEGVRKTLELYLIDGTMGGEGTRTDWVIHEYHLLRYELYAISLKEDVVLCKLLKKDNCLDGYFEYYEKSYSVDDLQQGSLYQNELANVELRNVWQHFTKIQTNDDTDEVYAACHRCDQLLKAHPKKHGTSQLERHKNSDKCRSCCSNPSTDEDREMLRLLRAVLDDPYEQQKMEEKLHCQEDLTKLDPWDPNLAHRTPWYVTRSFNRQTQGGQWKEIRKEFTAIRMEQQQKQGSWKDIAKDITVLQLQMQVPQPQYMGLRRTLQFHSQDGKKMDWIMLEYQQLDDIEAPALFLQGDMVIRKVLHYDKNAVASAFRDLNRFLNGDDDSEEYYYKGEGANMDTLFSDCRHVEGNRKRKRSAASKWTSELWMYFTKLRTPDPKVVYTVCHHCDRGYTSGCSTNGTSHLWTHKKSCTNKLAGIGNVNNGANAAWEAEIWPLLLLLKNYGGCDLFSVSETENQALGMC